MKNTKAQIPDEADLYRAITRAAERGDLELAATDSQPTPKRPPMSVGTYRLRKRLRQIDD
jgi:hypothetical protein